MQNTQKEFLAREIENTLKDKEYWIAQFGKDDAQIKYFDELLESLNAELANV